MNSPADLDNLSQPIIIGGFEGSGTSMFVRTLDKHRNIVGYNETQLIRVLPYVEKHLLSDERDTFKRYLSRYFDREDVYKAMQDFINSMLRKPVIGAGKRRWADKTPSNYQHWALWKRIFPKAKLIHVVRDGRDCVVSGVHHNYYTFREGVIRWRDAVRLAHDTGRDYSDDFLEIKYEDIVMNTANALREVLSFLDEPWDPAVLDLSRSGKFLRQWGDNGDMKRPIGRWERAESFDKEYFLQEAGELSAELGYEIRSDSCEVSG